MITQRRVFNLCLLIASCAIFLYYKDMWTSPAYKDEKNLEEMDSTVSESLRSEDTTDNYKRTEITVQNKNPDDYTSHIKHSKEALSNVASHKPYITEMETLTNTVSHKHNITEKKTFANVKGVTDKKKRLSKNDLHDVQAQRTSTLEKRCKELGITQKPRLSSFNSISDKNNFAKFCKIQKAGSTFGSSVMSVIVRKEDKMKSPEPEISKKDVNEENGKHYGEATDSDPLMIMFVRDPFERALSGYTDKFFKANALFWRILGTHIVNITRANPQKKSLECGHDVTFTEFVKYIIHAEKTNTFRNDHFYPMYSHCSPCAIHYDVIGKLESIHSDVDYIYNVINDRHNLNISSLELFGRTDHLRINFLIGQMYSMREKIVRCMPFYEAMLRIWKSFQIRGFLAKNVSMPFDKKEANDMEKGEFYRIVLEAHAESGSKESMRNNKEEAFREAYHSVPKEYLEQLSAVFSVDCQLFEYDCRPPKIFDGPRNTIKSNYFKIDY